MHSNEIQKILSQNTWFASLPESLADMLLEKGKVKVLHDQQTLHQKNDLADGFHCVVIGRIRISNFTVEGKELVLTWIQPGNWFGEISLIDGQPRTHDAHAEGTTTLLKVPKSAFEQLFIDHHQWSRHIMRLLCQRVRATFSLIDETGCLSLKGQLCKRLSLMYQGLEEQQSKSMEITISQDALAQLIHSSRQTVNKILQGLQKEKVITLRYGEVVILDRNALEALSQI
ncbi:Crp/Fnr family transcriptional regulator [Paraglaciecola sp. MB-3u-78]|uniref:Crp/Fnr family transcriptional regulator n=1 Tax=Paraglaciecola sp. MB-3u-78 TaxID=2058332 RepID=UPI000C346EC1|nr:Crp/Fnr family transcriptional regulator [Paraglaciecola sp. MB-3u-78]PKG97360.1 Crp/Fnr family transcriptional regulator [Paraglaciecola sp. MB-3u-78]